MTDLTDRMRTLAAHVMANDAHDRDDGAGLVLRDAAALLLEAAGVLEESGVGTVVMDQQTAEALDLVPVPIIEPLTKKEDWKLDTQGTWIAPGGALPTTGVRINPRACPKCDSRAWKKVTHQGKQVMLTCPACGTQWEWRAS
jgi:hypothetical protein